MAGDLITHLGEDGEVEKQMPRPATIDPAVDLRHVDARRRSENGPEASDVHGRVGSITSPAYLPGLNRTNTRRSAGG